MPSFSIVIPTYRRPASALACLESLLLLEPPNEPFEVILVEDGEGPEPLLDTDLERFVEPLRLRVIRQENAGPAAARNRGVAAATGDWIAFTDDDCRPDPLWLQALESQFERTPDAVVGGRTENALPERACSEASQVLLDFIYGYFLEKGDPFFASNNLALSRANFERIGGFDETFGGAGGEDREFCARGVRVGLGFEYQTGAVVQHYHDLSLRRFLSQHFNYGKGAHTYHRGLSEVGKQGVELEPLSFYVDLVKSPWKLPPERRLRFGSTLMVLSQLGNAAGYFAARFASSEPPASAQTAATEGAQARLVARHAGGTWSANVLGVGCRYFAMFGATRILGDQLYGDYTLSLAITGIFASIAVLGLSPGLLPFLSRARKADDPLEVRAVVRSAFWPVLAFASLLTFAVFALAPWAGEQLFHKPDLQRFLAPMSGLILLGALLTVTVTLLQGFMAVSQRIWIERVLVVGVIAMGMGASWALDLGVDGVLAATLGGAAAGLLVGLPMLARRASGALRLGAPAAALRIRAMLNFSWPLMGTTILAYLLLWTDVLSMGVLANSEEVGIYGACARIAVIAMIAHESLGPVFIARLSDLFTAEDWPGIRHAYQLTARWAMWPGLVLAWSFGIWGAEVLGMFGPAFKSGAGVLAVLCIGKAVAASSGMSGRMLGITGHARLNLVNMGLLVGGNLALNILWIPRYGGIGAAAATSLSVILVRALQVTEVRLLFGFLPWNRRSLTPLLGISTLALMSYTWRAGLGGDWGWLLPQAVFLVACAALFLLTSVGEDERSAWAALRKR